MGLLLGFSEGAADGKPVGDLDDGLVVGTVVGT